MHHISKSEESLSLYIHRIECFQISPINSPLKFHLQNFNLLVVFDFFLKEQSELLFNREWEALAWRAVIAWPLGDHWTHVEVITRQDHFHEPISSFDENWVQLTLCNWDHYLRLNRSKKLPCHSLSLTSGRSHFPWTSVSVLNSVTYWRKRQISSWVTRLSWCLLILQKAAYGSKSLISLRIYLWRSISSSRSPISRKKSLRRY